MPKQSKSFLKTMVGSFEGSAKQSMRMTRIRGGVGAQLMGLIMAVVVLGIVWFFLACFYLITGPIALLAHFQLKQSAEKSPVQSTKA